LYGLCHRILSPSHRAGRCIRAGTLEMVLFIEAVLLVVKADFCFVLQLKRVGEPNYIVVLRCFGTRAISSQWRNATDRSPIWKVHVEHREILIAIVNEV